MEKYISDKSIILQCRVLMCLFIRVMTNTPKYYLNKYYKIYKLSVHETYHHYSCPFLKYKNKECLQYCPQKVPYPVNIYRNE